MPRPTQADVWSQVAFYASLGFIVPAGAVAGYGIGWFLDRHLGTRMVLAVVGSMLGAAAGIVEVIRLLARKEKSEEDHNPGPR